MTNEEYLKRKKILSWNIGIHIFLSIITYFIWTAMMISYKKSCKEYESKTEEDKEENLIVKDIYFNVAGISFDGRQEIIDKELHYALKNDYLEEYDGLTNKEIIEMDEGMPEFNYVEVSKLRLEPTTLNNKEVIEIHITMFTGKEYHIGYVPKKDLDMVFDFLEYYQNNQELKLKATGFITGGKIKQIEYDEDDKPFIDIVEYTYGISINLKLIK